MRGMVLMSKVFEKALLVGLLTSVVAGSVSDVAGAQTRTPQQGTSSPGRIIPDPVGEAVSRLRSGQPSAQRKEIYVDGKPVFLVGVATDGSLLNIDRGAYIQNRVNDLSHEAFRAPDLQVKFASKPGGTVVAVVGSKERDILTVTKEDLWILGRSTYEGLQQKQMERAEEIVQSLTAAIREGREERTKAAIKKNSKSLLLRLSTYGGVSVTLFLLCLALERVLHAREGVRQTNEGQEAAIKSALAFLSLSKVTIGAVGAGGILFDALASFPTTRMASLLVFRGGASIAWIAGGIVGSLLATRALHIIIGAIEGRFLAQYGTHSRKARRARTLLPIGRTVASWGTTLLIGLGLAYVQFGMIGVSLIIGALWFTGPRWIPSNDLARALVILFSDIYVEGDLLLREGEAMVVKEIQLFHTTLETTENSIAIKVPNSLMTEVRVLNHDGLICVDQRYSVPYDEDVDRAAKALTSVVRSFNENESSLLRQEGELIRGVQAFGSSGAELRIIFWLDAERSDYVSQYLRFTRSLNYAVMKALGDIGIQIPVPEFKVKIS